MTALSRPACAGAVTLTTAPASAVPADDRWLTASELFWLSSRRVAKRRADWRLGRWVAKRAVAEAAGHGDLDPADVEILASPGGAPLASFRVPGEWPPITLSLSHSGGVGFAAAVPLPGRLGCDVEVVTPHSDAFVADYFTASERAWILAANGERDLRATLLWSAKESALKALGEGLRLDTRSVEVTAEAPPPADGAWVQMSVRSTDGTDFEACWRRSDGLVWTLAWCGLNTHPD